MPDPTTLPPIILYHYPFSPYARRVIWYLRLRGIPYMQCIQPPMLPRPDLSHLGISYRRIPLLSIGGDVYLDSRLILAKLESLLVPSSGGSPPPPLGAPEGTPERATERLLSTLTTSTGLFFHAAKLLPDSLPLMQDPKFVRDRADFFGGGGGKTKVGEAHEGRPPAEGEVAEKAAVRADALCEVAAVMELLESTVFADGREWVLGGGGEGPKLADIEAIWPLHWLVTLPGPPALDPARVSRERFPRVFAWIERFQAAVREAKGGEVRTLSGEEAAAVIRTAGLFEESRLGVDETESLVRALGLRRGDVVEVWPTDSGSGHRDRGRLVGIGTDEVVWETEIGVRVHAPRGGFRVRPAGRGPSL
ncbi:Glutathione S-transferase U4 [Madurella mycetomatis]|uniref:Glutathione S-transferase U4 n=1 Tax=Madurella mycetomatis TaxID=100816 RepID=A0A175WE91_9PEZI|nr:Glutathione S-transferase U4 [Madurella mycetomatis]